MQLNLRSKQQHLRLSQQQRTQQQQEEGLYNPLYIEYLKREEQRKKKLENEFIKNRISFNPLENINFADYVMTYVKTMNQKKFHISTIDLSKNSISVDFYSNLDVSEEIYDNFDYYKKWIKQTKSVRLLDCLKYKRDIDKQAYIMALYIILKTQLNNFINNRNIDYLVINDNTSIGTTMYLYDIKYRNLSNKTHFISKIDEIKVMLNNNVKLNMSIISDISRKYNFNHNYDMNNIDITQNDLQQIKDLFIRDYTDKKNNLAIAFCMGLHIRLGQDSKVQIFSSNLDILRMIIEILLSDMNSII